MPASILRVPAEHAVEHETNATSLPTEGVSQPPSLIGLDGYAARVVRHWARRLVRELRLPATDIADLEQELWLDLVVRWPRYDAERASPKTFASRVVQRKAATLRQNLRKAARRRMRRLPGESKLDPDSSSDEQEPTAASAALLAPISHEAGLSDDVASVVTRLPTSLGDLCRRLMCDDVSGVARQLGVSRTAIYRRIRVARVQFVAAEVHEYLQTARTL